MAKKRAKKVRAKTRTGHDLIAPPAIDVATLTELPEDIRLMIQNYFYLLCIRMSLLDWQLVLTDKFASEEHGAEVVIYSTYRRATVSVSHAFLQMSPPEQRHWATHEMAHLVLADYQEITGELVERLEPVPGGFAWSHYEIDDAAADHIARIVEGSLPLPDFWLV